MVLPTMLFSTLGALAIVPAALGSPAPLLANRAAATQCGVKGYDKGKSIAYSYTAGSATYARCSAKCQADTACNMFAFGSNSCLLYKSTSATNFEADKDSTYTFYDKACLSGSSSPTSTAASSSTSQPASATIRPIPAAKCGTAGYDKGKPSAFYYSKSKASSTLEGCSSVCKKQKGCLSLAVGNGECLLYKSAVSASNLDADSSSKYKFYDAACFAPVTAEGTAAVSATLAALPAGLTGNILEDGTAIVVGTTPENTPLLQLRSRLHRRQSASTFTQCVSQCASQGRTTCTLAAFNARTGVCTTGLFQCTLPPAGSQFAVFVGTSTSISVPSCLYEPAFTSGLAPVSTSTSAPVLSTSTSNPVSSSASAATVQVTSAATTTATAQGTSAVATSASASSTVSASVASSAVSSVVTSSAVSSVGASSTVSAAEIASTATGASSAGSAINVSSTIAAAGLTSTATGASSTAATTDVSSSASIVVGTATAATVTSATATTTSTPPIRVATNAAEVAAVVAALPTGLTGNVLENGSVVVIGSTPEGNSASALKARFHRREAAASTFDQCVSQCASQGTSVCTIAAFNTRTSVCTTELFECALPPAGSQFAVFVGTSTSVDVPACMYEPTFTSALVVVATSTTTTASASATATTTAKATTTKAKTTKAKTTTSAQTTATAQDTAGAQTTTTAKATTTKAAKAKTTTTTAPAEQTTTATAPAEQTTTTTAAKTTTTKAAKAKTTTTTAPAEQATTTAAQTATTLQTTTTKAAKAKATTTTTKMSEPTVAP